MRRNRRIAVTRHGLGAAQEPVEEVNAFVASVAAKASLNKLRSRIYTYVMALATTAIPAVVAIAPTPIWVKLSTLALSLIMVVATVSLDLERPHERWYLYRRYQRIVEIERTNFRYGLDVYKGLSANEQASLLVERLSTIQYDLHVDWEGLMPTRAEILSNLRNPGVPRGN